MSSSTGPRRRHPPSVYWRRRAVALLVLLLLVGGIVWGVSALLGRDAGAAPPSSGEGTPEAQEQPTEAPTTPAPTPEPTTGGVAACDAGTVEARVALEPAALAVGSGTTFQVTVRNAGQGPCLLDAGPRALVATVVSGADQVWTSAQCAGDATNELLLDAGAEAPVSLAWDGRRSAEGCPADQPFAGAGTYRVGLTLGGQPVGGEPVVFTIG
ncbi:hypothetical protein FHE66_13020 [Georgenia sp. 311]|uniref:DUF4232 domain-containing protein n=1 Tax=Georgenia wutianyii TaxID=2585135 RepID=A0ABX5VT03_9MICO|nr:MULTISPECIES: hypothetical protein [Georgenia]QDB80339.1 hypothetical protein FE251_13830 [Georgenia wutianyii]TNC16962.1 hypothetical protein FHE66_13020 [Georgenia sp. 311]